MSVIRSALIALFLCASALGQSAFYTDDPRSYVEHVIVEHPDLYLHLPMNDGGNVTLPVSYGDHGGTVTAAPDAPGLGFGLIPEGGVGFSYDFDGVDDRYSWFDPQIDAFASDFSMFAWLESDMVVGPFGLADPIVSFENFRVQLGENGTNWRILFYFWDGTIPAQSTIVDLPVAFDATQPFFWGVEFNAAASTMRLVVDDGTTEVDTTFGVVDIPIPSAVWNLGAWEDLSPFGFGWQYFDGEMDAFTIIQASNVDVTTYRDHGLEDLRFKRGDSNQDGSVNFADIIHIGAVVFDGAPFDCARASNPNGDGQVSIADQVYLANWLFSGGPPPLPPGPDECGIADDLWCDQGGACP